MKYSLILSDPPWTFKNYSDKWHANNPGSRWVGNEYGLMSLDEIKKLDVRSISADDSVLFLWATYPSLPNALEVMGAWGFTYKTCAFTWMKTNRKSNSPFMGMGYYTRANCEVVLLGVHGKPLPRLTHSIRQLVISPVRKHSQKPDEVRNKIVDLFGNLPRLEMFAREKTPGWDAWGLDVDSDVEIRRDE